MPHLDQLRSAWALTSQNKKWKLTQNCAVKFLIEGPQRHLAAVSGGGQHHRRPDDWATGIVSFLKI